MHCPSKKCACVLGRSSAAGRKPTVKDVSMFGVINVLKGRLCPALTPACLDVNFAFIQVCCISDFPSNLFVGYSKLPRSETASMFQGMANTRLETESGCSERS